MKRRRRLKRCSWSWRGRGGCSTRSTVWAAAHRCAPPSCPRSGPQRVPQRKQVHPDSIISTRECTTEDGRGEVMVHRWCPWGWFLLAVSERTTASRHLRQLSFVPLCRHRRLSPSLSGSLALYSTPSRPPSPCRPVSSPCLAAAAAAAAQEAERAAGSSLCGPDRGRKRRHGGHPVASMSPQLPFSPASFRMSR